MPEDLRLADINKQNGNANKGASIFRVGAAAPSERFKWTFYQQSFILLVQN